MASCIQLSAESVLWAGSVPAPAWTVALFGAAIVCSGAAYFVWRVRRGRKRESGRFYDASKER